MQLIDFIDKIILETAILKDGGAAVKNVVRIPRENILPTLKNFISYYIKPVFHIDLDTSDDIFFFGSTNKKSESGDIDIAIAFKNLGYNNLQDALMNLYLYSRKQDFTTDIVINTVSNDMIHYAFPQYDKNGHQIDKQVQIDVYFSEYPEFCKFFTYFPGEGYTQYKSAHRNELLRAIATVISKKVIYVDKETEEELIWSQTDINNNGLFNETKTLIDDYGNRLKYKDTDEDLIHSYAKITKSVCITHEPQECINYLVGNYSPADIDSFEKLYDIIKNDPKFKYSEFSEDILYEAAQRLSENTRLDMPEELKTYLN